MGTGWSCRVAVPWAWGTALPMHFAPQPVPGACRGNLTWLRVRAGGCHGWHGELTDLPPSWDRQ